MISLVLGTRGRPANLQRFLQSAKDHSGGDYEVVLRLDDDDPTLDECLRIAKLYGAKVIVGERCVLSDMWTECAHASSGDIYWMQDDEIVFVSENWVNAIESFFVGYGDQLLVGGADESHGGQHFCCPILTKRWVEVTGHTYPLGFHGDWGDVWLCDVARACNRWFFVPGLIVEQLAASLDKAPHDQTYLDRQQNNADHNVHQHFLETAPQREAEIARVKALLPQSQ